MKTQEEIELELNLVNDRINVIERQLQMLDLEDEIYSMLDNRLRLLYEQQLTLEWVLTEKTEL